MAYKITDSCLKCGTCAGECPMNAISEGEDQYVIDADTCVGCGTCADACPVQGSTPSLNMNSAMARYIAPVST